MLAHLYGKLRSQQCNPHRKYIGFTFFYDKKYSTENSNTYHAPKRTKHGEIVKCFGNPFYTHAVHQLRKRLINRHNKRVMNKGIYNFIEQQQIGNKGKQQQR